MAKVSLRAYNREIEAMIDRNHLDEAVAHCQHILKTFPKHLETYRLLGKAYLEAKRYNEAVDIFSRVLAAEPNDFVAHVGLSIVRDEQNKLDDAIWHMERAFEVQSANPAIQNELQRLYGRRDGVQPGRIRMTRGALAHMYMRGELFPQAISETKNILEEDPGRSDMQVLRARAFFKSGQKNDAAEAASAVLKRYPFCLDANLVLAEILGIDRPESGQVYRQRVVELDPYAAQAAESMFRANEVSDAAVSIEHLDWNGQAVGMSTDWASTRAIGLESGVREEQPDWMKNALTDGAPPPAPAFAAESESVPAPALPADDIPDFLRAAGWGANTGAFDESKSSAMFSDEPAPAAEPLEQGDLPDWVKAMAPVETSPAAGGQEEELPDWINKIGTEDLPVPAAESALGGQTDWMQEPDGREESAPAAAGDLDWLKGLEAEETPAPASAEQPAPASTEDLDWLKGLEGEEMSASMAAGQPAPASADDLDWLKSLEAEETSASTPAGQPDWLKSLGGEEQPVSSAEEQPDWLKGLSSEETLGSVSAEQPNWLKDLGGEEQPVSSAEEQTDWLKGLAPEETLEPASTEQPDWLKDLEAESLPSEPAAEADLLGKLPAEPARAEDLGRSAAEQDDSFAWLEALAAKQGATEGLLTKPEERLEQEPDWVKQVKKSTGELKPPPLEEPLMEPPVPLVAETPVKVEDLGKSTSEQDDSFAWLEALAAKQGATEGLLTKPEERLEQEPDWVKQVKKSTGELKPLPLEEPLVEPSAPLVAETPVKVEDLGKSTSEQDDSFAWLEALAAKQGATEGLLTKPEERLEQEPDWVKQVKKSTGELKPPAETPVQEPVAAAEPLVEPEDVLPPAAGGMEELGRSEAERDDSFAWLEALAARQGATEGLLTKPEERLEQEPDWVKQAKEVREVGIAPTMGMPDEIEAPQPEPAADEASWLKGLDESTPELAEVGEPAPVAGEDTLAWLKSLDEPEEEPIALPPAEDLPAWMQEIVQEEAPAAESAVPTEEAQVFAESAALVQDTPSEEVPAWLKGLEEEVQSPAIPLADDLPAWMRDETGEVVAEPTKIEPIRTSDWTPLDETRPEAVEAVPPAPAPVPEPKPASKPKKSASKKEEVKPAAPSEPYREPLTRRMTGMLTMPVDPILALARAELSRSNIPGALEAFGKLIKKGRFLEEVIFDLREALYRYPVEVSIWQSLGDAYMRANQLQEALDAYTKAEELLR